MWKNSYRKVSNCRWSTFDASGITLEMTRSFAQSPAEGQNLQGCHFFKVYDEGILAYILLAKGSGDDAYMIGKVAVSELQNLIVAYKERYDRNNFIQNLLLDNLLLVDIYSQAKKLHIQTEAMRVVYLIETRAPAFPRWTAPCRSHRIPRRRTLSGL